MKTSAHSGKSLTFGLFMLFFVHKVTSQQEFILEPKNVSAFAGATVILDCHIRNLVGQVQWTRSGFALGNQRDIPNFPRYEFVGNVERGEYNLMITPLELEDDGVYECQIGATATTAGMRSTPAYVTVKLPPDQPVIQGMYVRENKNYVDVVSDETFNLTCVAANARPAASIVWINSTGHQVDSTYSNVTVQEDGKHMDTTGILVLDPHKSNAGDRYKCCAVFSPEFSPKNTSVSQYLSVLYLPEVTMTVTPNRHIQEFDSMTFSCEADANPAEVTWTWFEGDRLIPNARASTLHIPEVLRTQHGKSIRCEATNSVGTTAQSFIINIEYGPQFTSLPQHASVDLGDDATLACFVDGNPSPAIVWTRKDSLSILGSSSALTITDVTADDLGVYSCKASVIGFEEITNDVHLMQNGPPRIESKAEQSSGFGSTGYVECIMWSAPKPRVIHWEKDGVPINFDDIDRYTLLETDIPTGWKSIIEITNVLEVDYGQFNCTVENEYGVDSLIIEFSKKDSLQMAYILAFVFAAIAVIILISILVVYHCRYGCNCKCRCKSDDGSQGSESSLNKTHSFEAPDVRVEYKQDIYGNPISMWQSDYDPKPNRYSADYDELRYPTDPRLSPVPYPADFPDLGYGPHDPRSDYGTYPRTNRLDLPYGPPPPAPFSDPYGTYRTNPPRHNYAASDYGVLPTPISVVPQRPYAASDYGGTLPRPTSRLSTNV